MGTEDRAQELIVGCLAATGVVAAGSTLAQGGTPGLRMIVGLTVSAATLAVVSMGAPDLAGGMAVLVLTTTVFVYGAPLMNAVTSLVSGAPASAPSTTTTPNQKGLSV